MRSIHSGAVAESANAAPWATAITATTGDRVFVRGLPLDEAIGALSFADVVFRLWTGREGTTAERAVLDACLVSPLARSRRLEPEGCRHWQRAFSPLGRCTARS